MSSIWFTLGFVFIVFIACCTILIFGYILFSKAITSEKKKSEQLKPLFAMRRELEDIGGLLFTVLVTSADRCVTGLHVCYEKRNKEHDDE